MQIGRFAWTDLSTYDLGRAEKDYATLFGWRYTGPKSYRFACDGDHAVAALFKMPKPLAKLNMPSFWMSYISVDGLDDAVARAQAFPQVVVEISPQAFNENGRIALIRDPSGAGFTLYEGTEIADNIADASANPILGRYHHVADITTIAPFYEALFNWSYRQVTATPWPVFEVRHPDGDIVAHFEEVPEAIRGTFNYWMPCFAVADTSAFRTSLEARQGHHVATLTGKRHIVADRQGAHFIIAERAEKSGTGPWS